MNSLIKEIDSKGITLENRKWRDIRDDYWDFANSRMSIRYRVSYHYLNDLISRSI